MYLAKYPKENEMIETEPTEDAAGVREVDGQWYHTTEDERLVGPYESKELAETKLAEYCNWLNGESNE